MDKEDVYVEALLIFDQVDNQINLLLTAIKEGQDTSACFNTINTELRILQDMLENNDA